MAKGPGLLISADPKGSRGGGMKAKIASSSRAVLGSIRCGSSDLRRDVLTRPRGCSEPCDPWLSARAECLGKSRRANGKEILWETVFKVCRSHGGITGRDLSVAVANSSALECDFVILFARHAYLEYGLVALTRDPGRRSKTSWFATVWPRPPFVLGNLSCLRLSVCSPSSPVHIVPYGNFQHHGEHAVRLHP